MTWTFYTTFTQPLLAYTAGLHYTWSDNIIQKPLTVYSGGIRTSQEASEIIMKHQEGLGYTRPGRETSLGWEGRLFRESRLGRETSLGREIFSALRAGSSERAGGTGIASWTGHQPWLGGWPLQGKLAGEGEQAEQGDQPLVGADLQKEQIWLGTVKRWGMGGCGGGRIH